MHWRGLALTAGILLAAGAIVNIGVAWCCAAIGSTAPAGPMIEARAVRWPLGVPHDWPRPSARRLWPADVGCDVQTMHYIVIETSEPSYFLTEARCGWPMRTLRVGRLAVIDGLSVSYPRASVLMSGVHAPAWLGNFEITGGQIPLHPVLGGFLFNTLFYAAILTLPLTFLPLRRRLRGRRGHCPRCNYDLTGLKGPCPECGAPPSPVARASRPRPAKG